MAYICLKESLMEFSVFSMLPFSLLTLPLARQIVAPGPTNAQRMVLQPGKVLYRRQCTPSTSCGQRPPVSSSHS